MHRFERTRNKLYIHQVNEIRQAKILPAAVYSIIDIYMPVSMGDIPYRQFRGAPMLLFENTQ